MQTDSPTMGSRTSKQEMESLKPTIPYRFMYTGEIPSSCVPNMMKIFQRPQRSRQDWFQVVPCPTSSLAFLSDENCLLFGTLSFGTFSFEERSSGSDLYTLYQIDLYSDEIQEILGSSVCDISVSSNGECVAIIIYGGYSHLQLWQCKSMLNLCNQIKIHLVDKVIEESIISHTTCCSFSPNGKWLVLAVCSDFFTVKSKNRLDVYTVNMNTLSKKPHAYTDVKKKFNATSQEMVIISLEFSSDNELLAAGSFQTQDSRVFLISTKTWMVIADVGKNVESVSSIWGVFNPLSTHQLISLTKWGHLKKWNTSSLYDGTDQLLKETDEMSFTNIKISDQASVASCPKLSSDGNLCAVPLSDACVIILDPNLFQILWTIHCPNFQSELDSNMPEYLQATSVCFSKSCEYLAVGYSGDVASVWLLPRTHFTLKHLCRTKIICMCPPNLVHKLPIPKSLKQYLLYQL